MQRMLIYVVLLALAVFGATASALMKEDLRPQLSRGHGPAPKPSSTEVLPQAYLNQSRFHKMIVSQREAAVYRELKRLKAVREEVNYGDFKLLIVDEGMLGGRESVRALQVSPRDDQNLIVLNDYLIDTSSAQPLSREIPTALRQNRMALARTSGLAPEGGLYLVQFIGPIQDAWLDTLKGTGSEIISYIPNNAYVVRADRQSAYGVWQLKERHSFVQWVGDYQPAFRLSPELRAIWASADRPYVKVTVQVLDGAEGDQTVESLKRYSQQFFRESRVMKYHNVTVTIPITQVAELAGLDCVFGIEMATQPVRLDEAQGQIAAGNLSGSSPTGPGYLSWLASKGFSRSQFNSFVVHVADDAYAISGHPDLPDDRIVFQNNPTGEPVGQSGHGFLNAQIIGGFNRQTGAPYEDSLGFNYGLGIVPWARIGVTAILGPNNFDPSAWEDVAYSQGARISSNSWGLSDELRQPIARYESFAQEFDQIVRDARSGEPGLQPLAVVFAAGNSGVAINTPATAKNVITVGASENVRPGTDGCGLTAVGADNANDIATFSGRGPVNLAGGDGRVKPDIVAPGTHIQGGVPQSDFVGGGICNMFYPAGQTLYGWSTGTSHAAPVVSGGAALVYQDFLNRGLAAPSPAMIKALLLNSAAYLSGTGGGDTLPSNSQGLGRLDLGRTFDGAPRMLVDQTQILHATGQTYQMTGFVASNSQPFRVTLAWTDAPGSTTGAPWVNNLDLEVTINGQTYRGNVFSGANSTTGGSADPRNNVESVFIPAGVCGKFTVTVRASNIPGDGVPGNGDWTDQDFALVLYNAKATR